MDSLVNHSTWDFIPKADIQSGHKPLKKKWMYNIKQDVNNQMTWFKARQVVKKYLQ